MTKNNYFSFANTHAGCVSYSEHIFNPRSFDKIYVVKGVFAQEFISEVAKKISNAVTECFINPINPQKTDGIIIDKTAVIDSFLANFNDSHFPALIINLGEFCNESLLAQHKEQIFKISEEQQEIYRSTQKFLKAANELSEYLLDLSAKYLDEKKLIFAIDRILAKYNKINNDETEFRFINSSFGNKLDTVENKASKIFYISDEYFSGFHFLRCLSEKKLGSTVICPDALNTERIRAIYRKEDNILFEMQSKPNPTDEKYNYINMERFIHADFKKDHKQKLKFVKKIYDSLIKEIADCFAELKNTSSELKKIYAPAVGNIAQQKFTADFIKKL